MTSLAYSALHNQAFTTGSRPSLRPPTPRPHGAARIYRQRGASFGEPWVLDFEPAGAPRLEERHGSGGWPVHYRFPARERAEAFARHRGWSYLVLDDGEAAPRRRGPADNVVPLRRSDRDWRWPRVIP